jgi:hypothetical protein
LFKRLLYPAFSGLQRYANFFYCQMLFEICFAGNWPG